MFPARHIVIEAIFDRRANRYLGVGPEFLNCLGKNMGGVMPQQLEAIF